MEDLEGRIIDVATYITGSGLDDDAPSGSTVLYLDNVQDFNDEGGQIRIDGDAAVTYLARDVLNNTLTLSAPTLRLYEMGSRVNIEPYSSEKRAHVILAGDEDDAITAIVPYSDTIQLADGVRDVEFQESVTVREDNGQYSISSINGQEPTVDGSYIDPATLPEAEAAEPPDSSPTLTGVGDAKGIILVAEGIVDQTTILDYYIDGVLFESTRSTIVRTEVDSLGADLVSGQNYEFHVIATNSAGSAAPSPSITVQLDPDKSPEWVIGQLNAAIINGGSLNIGGITITPPTDNDSGGILIPQTNGGLTRMAADGSGNHFAGTATFDEMDAKNVDFQGKNNHLTPGSAIQLDSGVANPKVGPRVLHQPWNTNQNRLDINFANGQASRLLIDFDATYWLTVHDVNKTTKLESFDIYKVHKTTGAMTLWSDGGVGPHYLLGLTRMGSLVYILRWQPSTGICEVSIRNLDGTLNSSFNWPGGVDAIPAGAILSHNGTNLLLISRITSGADTNKLKISSHNPTTGALISTVITATTVPDDPQGHYFGNADFGAARHVIATYSGIRVYDTAGAAWTGSNWTRANGENVRGLAWDGTRFYSLGVTLNNYDPTSARVLYYSTLTTNTSRSVTYTYYDDDAGGTGTHETAASPATVFTQSRRWWLRVEADLATDSGDPDDPNSVRFYVANKRQADLASGVGFAIYDEPSTSGVAAPAANNFPVSGWGEIYSEDTQAGVRHIFLRGNGFVRLSKFLQSGSFPVPAAGSVGQHLTGTVTFSTPFDAIPMIQLQETGLGAPAYDINIWPTAISATGFTWNSRRGDGTTGYTVHWFANVDNVT